jgi:hypothetical protein
MYSITVPEEEHSVQFELAVVSISSHSSALTLAATAAAAAVELLDCCYTHIHYTLHIRNHR